MQNMIEHHCIIKVYNKCVQLIKNSKILAPPCPSLTWRSKTSCNYFAHENQTIKQAHDRVISYKCTDFYFWDCDSNLLSLKKIYFTISFLDSSLIKRLPLLAGSLWENNPRLNAPIIFQNLLGKKGITYKVFDVEAVLFLICFKMMLWKVCPVPVFEILWRQNGHTYYKIFSCRPNVYSPLEPNTVVRESEQAMVEWEMIK